MLWRLPDSPMTTKILTEEERVIAIERLKSNKAGYKSNKLNAGQIIEAFIDYKTWMLAIYVIGTCIPNGGLTAVNRDIIYQPLLVQRLTNTFSSSQAKSSKDSGILPIEHSSSECHPGRSCSLVFCCRKISTYLSQLIHVTDGK